jgi:hypothetical protein
VIGGGLRLRLGHGRGAFLIRSAGAPRITAHREPGVPPR